MDLSDGNYKEVDNTPFEYLEIVGVNTIQDNEDLVNVSVSPCLVLSL